MKCNFIRFQVSSDDAFLFLAKVFPGKLQLNKEFNGKNERLQIKGI